MSSVSAKDVRNDSIRQSYVVAAARTPESTEYPSCSLVRNLPMLARVEFQQTRLRAHITVSLIANVEPILDAVVDILGSFPQVVGRHGEEKRALDWPLVPWQGSGLQVDNIMSVSSIASSL